MKVVNKSKKNKKQAELCYTKAAELGNEEAAEYLTNMKSQTKNKKKK